MGFALPNGAYRLYNRDIQYPANDPRPAAALPPPFPRSN